MEDLIKQIRNRSNSPLSNTNKIQNSRSTSPNNNTKIIIDKNIQEALNNKYSI